MLTTLAAAAALLAVTALVDALSGRTKLPQSIVLVLSGVLLGFLPGIGPVNVDPDFVILGLIPPLLYSAGVGMSWPGFRRHLRPILLLAVGCVVFTASAVAAAAHLLLGLTWPVGFVLGAVVAPPDSVAPIAIARRLRMPRTLLTVIEGEGLVNDATALVLFSFAVTSLVTGRFSAVSAAGLFAAVVVGEVAWGVAVAWLALKVRRWARSPQAEILLALLTPYLAFWPPHAAGGSGVLAAVACGLYVSWNGPRLIGAATRLQGYFVWGLVTHSVESLLFLLIGLQAKPLTAGLGETGWERLLFAAGVVTTVLVVVRFVWVFPATYLPRLFASVRRREPRLHWSAPAFIGFAGIRGVVSLAAALSIPRRVGSGPFPERDLLIFVTFAVIVLTLLGQGALLPRVTRALTLRAQGESEAADDKAAEVTARLAGLDAVVSALARLVRAGESVTSVEALRRRYCDRRSEYADAISDPRKADLLIADARLQSQLIGVERDVINAAYGREEITDEARRRIERELDLEHARSIHALESATGSRLADPEAEFGDAY